MRKIRYRVIALVMILAMLFSVILPMEEVQAAESGRISIKATYDYEKAFEVLNQVNKQRSFWIQQCSGPMKRQYFFSMSAQMGRIVLRLLA